MRDTTKFVNSRLADSFQIDYQVTGEEIQAILKDNQNFYYALSTFEFNIFEFSSVVGRTMQMPVLSTALIQLNGLNGLIDQNKFLQFMIKIYNGYKRSVEYHNDLHGSDVAQHCHYILRSQNMGSYAKFDSFDTLSLIVAALCHDVGHDGFNNKFHVVTESDRFLMYGDVNVQESFHVAETLKLLNSNEYDFVQSKMTPMQAQHFRKRIVECIIHTDMAEMKGLRNRLSKHMEAFEIANG